MVEIDTHKIRALNDHARHSLTDCRVLVTPGVTALGSAALQIILHQIQTYDEFTEANDPYGEHDFGRITHQGCEIFWKWDYYDLDCSMHSLDASDPSITQRVLTIMLAEEY
jgi:hypothetical protein